MSAVPYRLLGESELLRVRSSLAQAVGRWRGSWLGDANDRILAVMPACELDRKALGLPDEASVARSLGGEKWIAALAGRRVTGALAAALAGPEAGGARPGMVTPLLHGVGDLCLASLCDEVIARPASETAADAAAPPSLAGALRKASGAAAALVEIGGERLGLVLGRDLVGGMIGAQRASARGGLEGRALCIQNGKVPVHVLAGSAEVGAAALATLAPGDVILLDTALDAAFGLVNTDGTTVARGYLGARAGRKAFQLTS